MSVSRPATRSGLAADLATLGVRPGAVLMVHAGVKALGPVLGGVETVVAALREALGPAGTLVAYAGFYDDYEEQLDVDGRCPAALRDQVPAFDPVASRANPDHGLLPEAIRTTPGALRSANPGASLTALGARADWLTASHPQDYGYGPGTPFARLVEAEGQVLMLGAPLDTITLLHHAEHLADLPGKRIVRREVPFRAADGGTAWRMIEEYDTADPVIDGLEDDFFGTIVEAWLATGRGADGRVGQARAVLVDAAPICRFAVEWMETRARDRRPG